MIYRHLLLSLIVILSLNNISFEQCNGITFEEGLKRSLLTPDLFNTALNAEFMGCPKYNQGDSNLCGIKNDDAGEWNINLPDALIFTAFFEPNHYAVCKSIFNDPFLIETIKKVPDPSNDALKWFKKRVTYHNFLIPTDTSRRVSDTLDILQKKMITVFYQIKSWTFCPEEYSTDLYTVHGAFDNNNNIIIYNTACKAGKVYDVDVQTMALALRLFFVCSHELSHAIDKCARVSLDTDIAKEKAEKRANVNGLIITTGLVKLLKKMFIEYKQAILIAPQKSVCDEYYINNLINQWGKVEVFFSSSTSNAKKLYVNGNQLVDIYKYNPNWTLAACLEPKSFYRKSK